MKHAALLLLLMFARPAFDRLDTTMIARGTFDVKVTPQSSDAPSGGPFGRFFLDKQFRGDLEAASRGQMLAAETAVAGSGAYVAFEFVTGTLQGKHGSFVLQHQRTMRQGAYALDVSLEPDSGTGGLVGIAGAMSIVIKGSEHSYEFTYAYR